MDGLRSRLMDPALFKVFAEEFAAEWNRLQSEVGANLSRTMSVGPHRRRIIGAGQRADGAPCRARTNAMDGRNRRRPAIANRDRQAPSGC